MPGLRLSKFSGLSPKTSPELLADGAAQVANNLDLSAGDLIPFTTPKLVGSVSRTDVKTLFPLYSSDNIRKWLSWATQVDVVLSASGDISERRFYYTGDGVPKVSNYKLAVQGLGPYPVDYYELGVPTPADSLKPTVTIATVSGNTATFARDSTGFVTLVTSSAHNIKSGTYITISGFTKIIGTFTQSGTHVTVTITDHGLIDGEAVQLEFSARSDAAPISCTTASRTSNVTTVNTATDHGLGMGNRFSLLDAGDFSTADSAVVSVGSSTSFTFTQIGSDVSSTSISSAKIYKIVEDVDANAVISGTYTVDNCATDTFDITAYSSTSVTGIASISLASINAITVESTRVDDTTLTYYSPGFAIKTTAYTSGKVELGGTIQERSYVFTYYTPWGEESIPSLPSLPIYQKEGVIVTVANLPTAKPSGKNNVRGIRLYRTLSSAVDADYFLLQTLWFPVSTSVGSRTSNVTTIVTQTEHNFIVGDRFKLAGGTTFDISTGEVTEVVDSFTFSFAQTGANVSSTSITSGVLYHDISENPSTDDPIYWGYSGSFSFIDNFDPRALSTVLASDEYDPPPEDLVGLVSLQNGILAGYVGKKIYFSEPGKPHAFPIKYVVTVEHDIAGLAVNSGYLLVVTTGYPYYISGNDPAALAVAKMPMLYPCTSSLGVVTTSSGVIYPSFAGLIVYSPGSIKPLTRFLFDNLTWTEFLDPTTIVGTYWNDCYYATHSTGAFIVSNDSKAGTLAESVDTSLVTTDYMYVAASYDSIEGKMYFTQDNTDNLYEWNNQLQPNATVTWKSKVIVTKDMINMGVAKVVGDYSESSNVTFKLYVDKDLIFTYSPTSSDTFRLPYGYKSDTFEVEVATDTRIRSIHLGTTPLSLKEV